MNQLIQLNFLTKANGKTLLTAELANQFGLDWIWVAVGVAVLQILSPFTKFCPVYTILNKLMPDSKPIQNGK